MPLLHRGPSCGHDFDFHLLSWLEAARDWHQGLVYPHWLSSANYGAGEPRFVFYPPVSWMLGATIGSLLTLVSGAQTAWSLTPAVFTLACLYFAGLACFALARSYTSRASATLAACLFAVNPYLLFNAYERAAYGELLSAGWIALLLLFSLGRPPRILPIALVIAALWLTNAPSAVMGCYTLVFVTVLRCAMERRWSFALSSAWAAALGCALPAFYLLPAAWQQRWVQIGRAIGPGMRIQDSFLFGHTGEVFHDQVLYTASSLAVLLFTAGVAASIRPLTHRLTQRAAIVPSLLLAVILLLQLPLSRPLWNLFPHLAFLQFPWRWLLVAGICAAMLLALSFETLRARALPALLVTVAIAASVWFSPRAFYQPCDDEDAIAPQLAVFRAGTGVEGTDEYTPVGADNSEIQQDLPEVRLLATPDADEGTSSANGNPEWTKTAADSAIGTATVTASEPQQERIVLHLTRPAYIVLRREDYPAWRIRLNQQPVTNRPRRDDGLIVIPAPAGASTLDITWQTTPDEVAGRTISVIALLILIPTRLRRRDHA